jgi:hypothetical protein
MPDLLRLPLFAADLATRPARFVVGKLLSLRGSDDDAYTPAEPPAARPEPPSAAEAATAPPPPVSEKPRPAPKKRAPAKKAPSVKATRRAVRHEPTKGEAAKIRQQARMEEQDAGSEGGPGATITIAPPWKGYDAMTEEQVLDRLTGADAATRAAVRLYEGIHGDRRQVMLATEETVAT